MSALLAGDAILPQLPQTRPAARQEETTVVSVGGGQDSTALLYRIGLDQEFRQRYAPGRVLAIMADTGDEHPETVAHLSVLAAFCAAHDIEWQYLSLDRGYHRGKWAGGLKATYNAYTSVGSQAYPKSCSENLKILPIYRYVAADFAHNYGGVAADKQSLYQYTSRFQQKVRVIIGIASGEEKRIAKTAAKVCVACDGEGVVGAIRAIADDHVVLAPLGTPKKDRCKKCGGTGFQKPRSKWFVETVERIYPLIDIGWDRQACQDYIRSVGKPVPPPSNCFMCPFKSRDEILWSWFIDPPRFAEWCQIETNKLAANVHMNAVVNLKTKRVENKNYGVYKLERLMDVVSERLTHYDKLGWSRDKTLAHIAHQRLSHGHCNTNAF